MYKIGEFSILAKTTVKTLRYYEKQKLLLPSYIDEETGYRYYEASKLVDLSRIISLRQLGMPIKDVKKVVDGDDIEKVLKEHKAELLAQATLARIQLTRINYLLKEENMNKQIIFKKLPKCTVYYMEGVIKDYSELTGFILSSGEECLKLNPNLKCIQPDYCYVNYLDGEYKENNIKVRYAQAVEKSGVESDKIKFMELEAIDAVCIYHKGSYSNLRNSYNAIMNYIEENGYEITDFPRECYIDGCWNKEYETDYLTEIEVPVRKIDEVKSGK